MKAAANNLAELAAIIMILITLAISTATLSLWMGGEANAAERGASSQTATFTGTR
jgi:hypothetical protein